MTALSRRLATVAVLIVAMSAAPAAAATPGTGWLDPSFGSGGAVEVPSVSTTRSVIAAKVQPGPTGRIFVYSWRETFANGYRIELTAFTPDGRLDPGFNHGRPRSVFWDSADDTDCCLIAGPFPTVDGGAEVLISFLSFFQVHRYTASGAVMWTRNLEGSALDMAKLAGNSARILSFDFFATPDADDLLLRGLTPTGVPDAKVGPAGMRPLDSRSGPAAIVADPLNRLYVVGNEFTGSDRSIEVSRRSGSGDVDATWGTAGRTVIPVEATDSSPRRPFSTARGVALAVDGSLFVAGEMRDGSTGQLVVVIRKLDPSGTPDPAFGDGGVLNLRGPTGSARLGAVALQADSRLFVSFVARGSTLQPMLARLDATTGAPDPSFGRDGFVSTAGFADDIVVTGDLDLLAASRVARGGGGAALYLSRRIR